MASFAARVTGIVLRVDERSGTKLNPTTGELRPWRMVTAKVLVGGEDLCEVTLADTQRHPEKGDAVDWLVQVANGGKYLNIDCRGDWTQDHTAQSA